MPTELSRTKILDISKNDPDCGKAKCLALKNGLIEQQEQFFVVGDEMADLLENDKISLYFKSMQILESLHEILAQLPLKLEKFETGKSERSFKKCFSSMGINFK